MTVDELASTVDDEFGSEVCVRKVINAVMEGESEFIDFIIVVSNAEVSWFGDESVLVVGDEKVSVLGDELSTLFGNELVSIICNERVSVFSKPD